MICVTELRDEPIATVLTGEEPFVAKPAPPLTTTKKKHPRPANILYVDDDVAIRLCWTELLTCAGYTVTAVADGFQAWEALQSNSFDLLVTDNDMPRLTGLELVAKARFEGMTLAIIMASGSLNYYSDAQSECLRLAALVPKPFAPDQLLEAIDRALVSARVQFDFRAKDSPAA